MTKTSVSAPLPKQIDRYQIRGVLGTGGFGCVYKGFDADLKREVALKVPWPQNEWSEQHEAAFLEEAEKAAQLRHQNVVTIYDVRRCADHGVYIVMEYVAGESLAHHLKRLEGQPMDVAMTVRVVSQVASAMHAAHQRGLVHRDLKPSNILLDGQGNAHVADFGLALLEERQAAERGIVSGTVPYMSPEQVSGKSQFLDGRSDIWSLGVVLYRCLSGRLPFASGRSFEVIREEIIHREPKPPRQINDQIPWRLEEICLKCLSKAVSERYRTAKDVEDELTHWKKLTASARDPVSESGGSFSESIGPLERGRALTVSSVLLLLCIGIVWFAVAYKSPTGQPGSGDVKPPSDAIDSPLSPNANDVVAVAPENVAQKVLVVTRPPGARIVVYPVRKPYGFADGTRRVEAQKRSPATLQLSPGSYLVVAVLDDGRFHEVYRNVPATPDSMAPQSYAHLYWRNRADDSVEWPEIDIPPAGIADDMALFVGASAFRLGSSDHPEIPEHNRSVPAFHLDTHEVSWGQLLANENIQIPASLLHLEDRLPDPSLPLAGVWYHDAVSYAEKIGKRLPTEAEYEFAATAGGTQRFPWGDDASLLQQWPLGAVGTPDFDCVVAGRPVFGLYSNVAEWTSSWASAYPPRLDYLPGLPPRPEGMWIVRGAPYSVITGAPDPDQFSPGPRFRIGQHEKAIHPGLGFRCARSVRPRLEASDLERFVGK
ncbi:MAG: bifunctional serine/threonine-protein kinase/formylglycine-generating enzyme family protein [Fuerstiella sp.]